MFSFSTLLVLYTPNWTTVYPVMQVLMGGGTLLSLRFGFLLFMILFPWQFRDLHVLSMWGVDLPMCSFMLCVRSYACLGLKVTYHPIRLWLDMMLQIHQQPRFAVQFQWQQLMQQLAYPIAAFVGEWNQSKCSFSIGHLQCCTWILERMSIQKCNGFGKSWKQC